MGRSFVHLFLGALAVAAPLLSTSSAFAQATCTLANGTTVDISNVSSCTVELSGGCTAQCTPLNFTATCNAMCTASASASCTSTCTSSCMTECTTKPATFTCAGYCQGDCVTSCMSGGGDMAGCTSSCEGQCGVSCQTTPGSTDCATACQNSCQGNCTVQANVSCDVGCQTMLSGGCSAQCSAPSGALFCDGQYIDVSDVSVNSSNCHFSVSASVKAGCSAAPGTESPYGIPGALGVLAGLGLVVARRRRNG